MEMQKKIMATEDRLSDLPDSLLLHILSMLQNGKAVVRSSVLSMRWRFLWMSVPISLLYMFPHDSKESTLDYLASIHRELYYWKYCQKILKFRVWGLTYEERYAKDVDLWVHFATKLANVEDFELGIIRVTNQKYEFPQFAYKNLWLRNLFLWHCQLSPRGSINWSSLVSFSIGFVELKDDIMKKVLSGCPNLECLELNQVWGLQRLEISSVKLIKLILQDYYNENDDICLEILAPYIQHLELSGLGSEISIEQRNVASLVSVNLCLDFDFQDKVRNLEKECSYFKKLLHSFAHVENLELGTWCIECMSILELKGWQSPPSSRKFLELSVTLSQLEFPGICSFLRSSSDLETLVIDWIWYNRKSRELLRKYTNDIEQSRRFKAHYFNCSLLHLKTIKFIDCFGPLSKNKSVLPLVKYLLKHATMLQKFVIAFRFNKSDVSQDYVKDLLSFPRSSPHASVIFSYSKC